MDIDEWDLLAVDGLLDFHEDGHGGKIYSRRRSCHSQTVLDMDHFRCPSPPADRIVPVAIGLGPEAAAGPPAVKGIADLPAGKVKAPSLGASGSEREVTPHAFFEKVARDKNEFVHMTMGEVTAATAAERESLCSPPRMPPRMRGEREAAAAMKDKSDAKCEVGEALWEQKRSESEGESNGVNNILKRSFTGIGALCSFGVAAAATLCFLILGSRQGNTRQSQQKQNLRFQIYSDDKRLKKVVHHATKLNEAISAVRGVPHTRAHIVVGGYYDTL